MLLLRIPKIDDRKLLRRDVFGPRPTWALLTSEASAPSEVLDPNLLVRGIEGELRTTLPRRLRQSAKPDKRTDLSFFLRLRLGLIRFCRRGGRWETPCPFAAT